MPSPPPVTFLMARSILSLGMLAARHFKSTMRRRGFMLGSPPPILAATAISLLNFAKILPRFASSAPLKCLTFAHLLCPAIGCVYDYNRGFIEHKGSGVQKKNLNREIREIRERRWGLSPKARTPKETTNEHKWTLMW